MGFFFLIFKVYKACLHITKTEMSKLLELKLFRDSNNAGGIDQGEDRDVEDRDNLNVNGDFDLGIAPSSEALDGDPS